MTLDQLKENESAIISSIEDEGLAIQLYSMGIIKGETILVERIAPFKDPIIISCGTNQICIRKKDAQKVVLKPNT